MGGADDHETYKKQLEEIVVALNGSGEQTVAMSTFDTISSFATQMRTLIDSSSPFTLVPGR
jgi:hypothetical protein